MCQAQDASHSAGFDPRPLTTAVLEALAWKTDVQDGQKLLPPLSACLTHLLSQQEQQPPAAAGEGEEDESLDTHWYAASLDC